MSTENEQIPDWFKPVEDLVDTLNDMVVAMSGAPAQPAKPTQPEEPEKTESELWGDQINADTARITGKQATSSVSVFSSFEPSTPTEGNDFSQIAAQIEKGTKQIVEQSKKK